MHSDSKFCIIKTSFAYYQTITVCLVTICEEHNMFKNFELKTKIDDMKHYYFKAYKIHTSEAFQGSVEKVGGFRFEMRGSIKVKVRYTT